MRNSKTLKMISVVLIISIMLSALVSTGMSITMPQKEDETASDNFYKIHHIRSASTNEYLSVVEAEDGTFQLVLVSDKVDDESQRWIFQWIGVNYYQIRAWFPIDNAIGMISNNAVSTTTAQPTITSNADGTVTFRLGAGFNALALGINGDKIQWQAYNNSVGQRWHLEVNPLSDTRGDVNQDGTVNQKDVDIIDEYRAGERTLSAVEFYMADVDRDGVIDIYDSLTISRFIEKSYLDNFTHGFTALELAEMKAVDDAIEDFLARAPESGWTQTNATNFLSDLSKNGTEEFPYSLVQSGSINAKSVNTVGLVSNCLISFTYASGAFGSFYLYPAQPTEEAKIYLKSSKKEFSTAEENTLVYFYAEAELGVGAITVMDADTNKPISTLLDEGGPCDLMMNDGVYSGEAVIDNSAKGVQYFYAVYQNGDETVISNTVSIQVYVPYVPNAPENLTSTSGDKQVTIYWSAPNYGGNASITHYEVSLNGVSWVMSYNKTNHTFTGLTNGQAYTFRVRAVNSYGGGAQAAIMSSPKSPNNAATPVITTQPASSVTVNAGETAKLSLSAVKSDSGTLSYQWYQNTVPSNTGVTLIHGATSETYDLPTTAAGTMYYYCIVTNTSSSVIGSKTAIATSIVSVVTIKAVDKASKPSITTQPSSTSKIIGDKAILSIAAAKSGNGTLSYQWYSNTENSSTGGTIIKGATWTNYSAPTTTAGTMYYYCIVTNTNDYAVENKSTTTTSNVARVTVTTFTPTVPSSPQKLSATPGDGQITIWWDEPDRDGGSPITSYMVSINGTTWSYPSSDMSHTFFNLINGETYTLRVRAVSALGNGAIATVVISPTDITHTCTNMCECEFCVCGCASKLCHDCYLKTCEDCNLPLASGTCGDDLTWILDRDGVLTISGTGEMTKWTADTQVGWVSYRDQIKTVIIEDGVTNIGMAFVNCRELTSVTIPDSIIKISSGAFFYCTSLTSITIPRNVIAIGNTAFRNCENLSDVYFTSATPLSTNIGGSGDIGIGIGTFSGVKSDARAHVPMSWGLKDGAKWNGLIVVTYCSCDKHGCNICAPCNDDDCTICPVASGTCGDNLTWVLDNDGVLTISGTGEMTKWSADTLVDWYAYLDQIKTVIIENGVTNIGNMAFYGCPSLTEITIPDSITSIGNYAFSDCESLTEITIPNSITSIGDGVFYCTSLTEITIPDNITSIGNYAFYGCANLTEITIPDSITSIGDGVFSYCTSLTEITIPDNITSIGNYTFFGCANLTEITIPDNITSIGNYAFYGCANLTEITIPDSITSIGNYAFSGCTSLASVTIGNSVTSIGSSAFYYCTSLTSVTIGNSVISIGNSAFGRCERLSDVYFSSAAPPSIGADVFEVKSDATAHVPASWGLTEGSTWNGLIVVNYCSCDKHGCNICDPCNDEDCTICPLASGTCGDNLTWVLDRDGTLTISGTGDMGYWWSNSMVPWSSYLGLIKTVVIEDGVTNIGNFAFYNCKKLTSVTIADSVITIGNYAFQDCTSLTSIIIPDSITSISHGMFLYCTSLTSITIPDSVTSIEGSAFYGCTKLTSITIPDSVTSIGGGAFGYCISLTTITLGSAIDINAGTFMNCVSLTSITIPDSVLGIGGDAFINCTSLSSITIPDSVLTISSNAFRNCTGLTTVTFMRATPPFFGNNDVFPANVTAIYVPKGSKSAYEDVEDLNGYNIVELSCCPNGDCIICTSLAYGTCGDNLTWVLDRDGTLTISGTGEMYDWANLSSVPIPWFDYGDDIKDIVIKNGVTTIGGFAFAYCEKLTSISIPDSITSIGDGVFLNCTSLTEITIPDSVISIGNNAFLLCTSLASVTIGNSVTSIGSSVFRYCTSLTSVTIGNSVTSIGNSAFSVCTSLTSVTIGNSVTSIGNSAFSGCASLASITIGNSVTSIGNGAFSGCTSLTSVTIGNSVKSIGRDAFSGCTSLSDVYFSSATPPSIDVAVFYEVKSDATAHVPASWGLTEGSAWNGLIVVNYCCNDSSCEICNYKFGESQIESEIEGVSVIANGIEGGIIKFKDGSEIVITEDNLEDLTIVVNDILLEGTVDNVDDLFKAILEFLMKK